MSSETVHPSVSVVINTYNRADSLRICLAALRHQTYDNFEVIVVNGPSTDDTESVISENPDVKAGHCPELNLSKSRNIGIALAAGDYVAFIDDDGIAEPTWIEELVRRFGTIPHAAAVAGYVKDPTGETFQAKRIVCDRFSNARVADFSDIPQYPHGFRFIAVMGCNCMFRRDALLEIGAFDEQYDYFLDETDICARIIDAGYAIDVAPHAAIVHKFADSPIRDHRRIVLDWSKIIKNTIYFIHQYEPVLGHEECEKAISGKIDERMQEIEEQVRQGLITRSEANESIMTVEAGLEFGRRDCARGSRLLISRQTLERYHRPFQRFHRREGVENSLTIVFFVNVYPPKILGGIGRFVHQKAVALAKMGQNVHVITPGDLPIDTLNFEDEVWVHRITFRDYPDRLLERDTMACDFLAPRLKQLYSYYEELLKIEERVHVDVVETPIWDCLGFYPLFDSRFKTIVSLQSCMKSVFTDPATMPKEVPVYMQMEHETLERCRYIMPISNAIRDQLVKYYGVDLRSKSEIVNLGLQDLAASFTPKPRNDDRIEVLFLGRLEHRKGIDVLMKAIPGLCEKHPRLLFRFAGDNKIRIPGREITYEQDFFAQPGNEKYRSNLCFEGIVSEERLRQLYAQCDIFVSPSRYESFGLIFLEAMMFAKPVVGCNAGGMPEVIGRHLETGMIAEPEDPVSLGACLDQLISDPQLRKRIGMAGRARYEAMFTDRRMAENSLAFYRKVVEGTFCVWYFNSENERMVSEA